jgi:hypothetical protein
MPARHPLHVLGEGGAPWWQKISLLREWTQEWRNGYGQPWTQVLLSAPEERRGGVIGLLSACMGTQPLGTLWLGMLATGIGVAPAIAASNLIALLAIAVAVPLARRGARAGDGRDGR